jgi:hypothetical protein
VKQLKSLPGAWRRLYRSSVQRLERLTPADITRLSWARSVKNIAALPEIYRPYIETTLAGAQDFPACILTPTYQGFLRQKN